MLSSILPREICAECRVCCVFDDTDIWEVPAISDELAETIKNKYRLSPELSPEYVTLSGNRIFKPEYDENELIRCPMLGGDGCVLGSDKPFDCKAWPFRLMKKAGEIVVTISPVCKYVSALGKDKLRDFFDARLSEAFKTELTKNPNIVKPYIDEYPVLKIL